jgi:flagellar biosynthesis/type III secretory pathway M-ring protein FliF/YscJ
VPQDFWTNALYSVTPTVLVGLVFWFVMRSIIRSDRTERDSLAKIEAEERAKARMPKPTSEA